MLTLKQKFQQILKLSRPRFWFYTAGTFLVGFSFGFNDLSNLDSNFFLWFLYFLIPANLLIYSVNDLSDEEVDVLNAKKDEKEIRVNNTNRNLVKYSFYVSLLISLLMFFLLKDFISLFLFSLFLFLGIFYSLKPLRFKTKIFLDFISNGFYVIPGFLGFYLFSNSLPETIFIIASILWAFSMHLFSAIVDIDSDKKANIQTTATYLGFNKSLVLCFVFWFIAWLLVYSKNILGFFVFIYLIYPLLPVIIIFSKNKDIEKIYWYYPFINVVLGFVLFLLLAILNI